MTRLRRKKYQKRIVFDSDGDISIREIPLSENENSLKWTRKRIDKKWTYLFAMTKSGFLIQFLLDKDTGKKIRIDNFMTIRSFKKLKKWILQTERFAFEYEERMRAQDELKMSSR